MVKVTLYMATTINGYIAKENDATPWSKEEFESFYKTATKFKNLVVGRRTYDIMKDDFESLGHPFVAVLTSQDMKSSKNFVFVKSAKEALEKMKKKGFTKVLLAGGGQVNSLFMREKLIDDIIIDVEPMAFGKGIKLFSDNEAHLNLKLKGSKKISKDTIQLHYSVVK